MKIKKLNKNTSISYANPGDAGADIIATSIKYDVKNDVLVYGTGLAVEIPQDHVGLLFPRSSIRKMDLTLANSVGVIDSGYRGEISASFNIIPDYDMIHMQGDTPMLDVEGNLQEFEAYSVGERIIQLVVVPFIRVGFEEVKDLSTTVRGEGGHGSTGR
jgi:dUTP pyrophosphatase